MSSSATDTDGVLDRVKRRLDDLCRDGGEGTVSFHAGEVTRVVDVRIWFAKDKIEVEQRAAELRRGGFFGDLKVKYAGGPPYRVEEHRSAKPTVDEMPTGKGRPTK